MPGGEAQANCKGEGEATRIMTNGDSNAQESMCHMNDFLARRGLPHTAATAEPQRRCPSCDASRVHRTVCRSFKERALKRLTQQRLFRCRACGWRGWGMPTPRRRTLVGVVNEGDADLRALDRVLNRVLTNEKRSD